MAKNIGFTKRYATLLAKTMCTSTTNAYVQKEEHFNYRKPTDIIGKDYGTYQWLVVLQKKVVGR